MVVCARCFGSTIGHTVAFVLMFFSFLPSWIVSVTLISVMLIDWSLQEFFGVPSNNIRRLVTGLLGGFGVGSLIWGFFLYLLRQVW
jgi:uncharacterized membrane protein